jgi:hypothetical protein
MRAALDGDRDAGITATHERAKMEPDEIRRLVVDEVAIQLKPFDAKLTKINNGLERIWNTNGGPPGYLQIRKIEDDAHNLMVTEYIETAQKRQIEAETRQKDREAKWNFWKPIIKKVCGALSAAILALGIWLGPKLVRVTIILWQDYLRSHPDAAQQISTADFHALPGPPKN